VCEEVWIMRERDSGSGTILGLGIILGLLVVLTLALGFEAENLALARLQANADSAAIAAEDALRGLSVGFPCETADQIVKEFGGTLEECHKVSSDIYIGVSQELLGIVHRVKARAGSGISPLR
jgi:secretion/DNA translocation related TadE-like protein